MKSDITVYTNKKTLLQPVIGLISFVFMCSNVFFWTLLVHLVAPLLCLRNTRYEDVAERCFNRLYDGWVASCEWWFQNLLGIRWELDETMKADFEHWHLLIANHRSWVDVFVIFAQLKGRRPLPRVFMKQALIWLPFVGSAAYIMGFPFMKRYTRSQIQKKPKLAGKDLATTKRSCSRLLRRPNSIMSFVEGTRFTEEKHQQQASPYHYLLKPKAGGISFIVQTMPERIKSITDINVLYEQKTITGWDLLCGRIGQVKVMVREVALPDIMLVPEYQAAGRDREHFFTWFNLYWHDKDIRMSHQLDTFRQMALDDLEQDFSKGNTSQE
ncbi:acyltransferase [Marinomonas rhizomae]|uniref:Acyltransferase-like protein n=1 Tax=Marinomonas rhizomae TaxID=491948 RepID=A0A366J7Q2_9GAMM|nr:acetyltransferase [Marinomonas rhizomae]RBP82430.1 acyltransferase-like protein [Marinomonas rhizomae]RNF73776.1 acyltransferase [Marinomonas rhizomae]